MKSAWRNFLANFIPAMALAVSLSLILQECLVTELPLWAILLLVPAILSIAAGITYNKYVRFGSIGLLAMGGMFFLTWALRQITVGLSVFPFYYEDVLESVLPAVGIVTGLSLFCFLFALHRAIFVPSFLGTAASILGVALAGFSFSPVPVAIAVAALYPLFYRAWIARSLRKVPKAHRNCFADDFHLLWRTAVPSLLLLLCFLGMRLDGVPFLGEKSALRIEVETILQDFSDTWNLGWDFDLPENLPTKDPTEEGLSGEIFHISQVGFGKPGVLGGDIGDRDGHHLLTVEGGEAGMYLAGASYEKYTGTSWTTGRTYQEKKDIFYSGRHSAAELPLVWYEEQYGRASDASVPANFRSVRVSHTSYFGTKTLFAPTFTTSLKPESFFQLQAIYASSEERFWAKNNVPADMVYEISYYKYRLTRDLYQQALWDRPDPYYAQLSLRDPNFQPSGGYTSYDQVHQDLQERADWIRQNYLSLPDSVTQRTRDLAQEITKDAQNDYEKAKAVEQYLSTSFPYTLTPGDVPKGEDFVDYFLFTGKKGYCVYFASAMTVLLRCVDVPARYVEGFYVSPKAEQVDGRFFLTGEHAHAWTEVYLEGIGFVTFEPTSSSSVDSPMAPDPTATSSRTPDKTPTTTPMTSPAPTPTSAPSTTKTPHPTEPVVPIVSIEPTESPDLLGTPVVTPNGTALPQPNPSSSPMTGKGESSIGRILGIVFLALLLLVAVVSVVLLLGKWIRVDWFRHRLKQREPEVCVATLFRRMECLLARYALPRHKSEGMEEYGARLRTAEWQILPGAADCYAGASKVYTSVRYQEERLQPEDRDEMLSHYDALVEAIRQKRGSIGFFFDRYFRGRL